MLSEDICPVLRQEIKALEADEIKDQAQIKANLTNKPVTISTPYHIYFMYEDGIARCMGMFINIEEAQCFINGSFNEIEIIKCNVRVCDYGQGCVRKEKVTEYEITPMNRDYVNQDGTPNEEKIQALREKKKIKN